MSLWWVNKKQLDPAQVALIETLPLEGRFLLLGPPGSGKTNVLLRRAQFIRTQGMPNVLVLTFTRPLTEFLKTGCYLNGREIFPPSCISTLESWVRQLYDTHGLRLPGQASDLNSWKRHLAMGALGVVSQKLLPRYDALFIDEAQDLLKEEVELISEWSSRLLFTGDDRQQLYHGAEGLAAVRELSNLSEETLSFHYRIAPKICEVADRILLPANGKSLASTEHYTGPTPARVNVQGAAMAKREQIGLVINALKDQIRVYADMLAAGDLLGVVVARKDDRDLVLQALESDAMLTGKSKIIRAREEGEAAYDPSFNPDAAICILTIQGCKGLEFRAVHWLFADDLDYYHTPEDYYTVVTRAKTSLDVYYTKSLPEVLARAYAETGGSIW